MSQLYVTIAREDMKKQALMTPCQLVRHRGYPCETSYATTDDAFRIQLIRVPHGIRNYGPGAAGGREGERTRRHPVLFVPPLLETSAVYFLNFPWESPGFLFADSGYDVWAMSNREASHYSNSTTLSQRDPRHWKWSFDELGRYDLAACIDHVLKETGVPKLTTVAFSQGVLANLVLHSVRPEYNNKRIIYPFTNAGFLGTTRFIRTLISAVCTIWEGTLCALAFTMLNFCSPDQFNAVYKARNFVMYDHGPSENLRRYGQRTAPAYPLDRIRLPIALFWSYGDNFAGEADVGTMAAALGSNVILNYQVPARDFRHLDFATGYRANDILHDVALDLVRKRAGRNP
ncbi:hypothetical protein HPB50_002190 [Hyalomma asiaticum]|uniref:Uncharacterized protein n=1 Tax=Hyalomma asiaticum TaxID=266040 RepID=A0ACB7RLL3_HYAAI|nr:hypothetical protein HPB50_002190 [Hyalomma asiaticum]